MATGEYLELIPTRLKNAAVGGYVAGAEDIIDDDFTIDGTTGQSQADINSYLDGNVSAKADKIPAEAFSDEKAYAVDDYVTYSGNLYKCTAAHAAGAWNSSDFTLVTDNFMAIDANGNIKDSGKKASDFLTQHQDISGKEDKTNKVTSISSSSTDTQYPSAKCVYDGDANLKRQIDFVREQLLIPDADKVIMTSDSNPVAMQVCYQQGWALNPDYMTYAEAQAVTDIGTAFRGNTELSHFEELQYFSITELDAYAFNGCSALAYLGLPPSLTKLDKTTTFAGTSGYRKGLFIRDVKSFCEVNSFNNGACLFQAPLYVKGVKVTFLGIPDGTVSLGNQIFGYAGLTGVSIPASVATIGNGVFLGDTVKKYVIGKSLSQWCLQAVGNSFWSAAEEITFNGVALGSTLTIPNDVTVINSYVFYGIGFVKTVIIPDSVTTIGMSSFNSCGAETVEIGSGITSMTWGTFDNLGNLKTLRCRATTAPSITSNTFERSGSSQTTLYVPANSTGYDTGNWASAISANGWTLSKTL